MSQSPPGLDRAALVLSGGGVRGAYEVGVMLGVTEVLGRSIDDEPPFGVFSGTSVGAINAAFFAANTHRGDLGAAELAKVWVGLKLRRHLQLDPFAMLGLPRLRWPGREKQPRRRSILDARALEQLVSDTIPWSHLRRNVAAGDTAGLFITALHVATGRTTVFSELADGVRFVPSADPRRVAKKEAITAKHVLASAALPLAFPAREVNGRYYCDGGIRFNTPIAPALRAGAGRLMIVTLMHEGSRPVMLEQEVPEQYPNPLFLAGKLLNALLLDPIVHDLAVLNRFNKLLHILDDTMEPHERAQVDQMLRTSRGAPYRVVKTLVFRPSVDIGLMAATHIRNNLKSWKLDSLASWLLGRIGRAEARWESDLASYLLFDGAFSAKLIELGRRDAHAKADEVHAFFD